MNLLIFIFVLIFNISHINAYFNEPDVTSLGWGIISAINGPASIGINPAGLPGARADYFSITLIKPFLFHNFNLLFILKNKLGIGISFLQSAFNSVKGKSIPLIVYEIVY